MLISFIASNIRNVSKTRQATCCCWRICWQCHVAKKINNIIKIGINVSLFKKVFLSDLQDQHEQKYIKEHACMSIHLF